MKSCTGRKKCLCSGEFLFQFWFYHVWFYFGFILDYLCPLFIFVICHLRLINPPVSVLLLSGLFFFYILPHTIFSEYCFLYFHSSHPSWYFSKSFPITSQLSEIPKSVFFGLFLVHFQSRLSFFHQSAAFSLDSIHVW